MCKAKVSHCQVQYGCIHSCFFGPNVFNGHRDLNFPQAFSRSNSYNLLAVSKKYDYKPQEKNRQGVTHKICLQYR